MIRRDYNGGWILITQYHHAILAGQIMSYWGNETFLKPDPYEEVLFAIREHDAGWEDWDSNPKINSENGYPANFTEMSPYDQSVIWSNCYRSNAKNHSYASALIALHFSKFNRSNLKEDPDNDHLKLLLLDMREVISQELGFKISDSNSDKIPEQVRVNLKLLQIGDIISLTLCHGWRSIEITETPISYEGDETTLKMESGDGLNYILSPYPFNTPSLNVRIEGRILNKKSFTDDDDLRTFIKNSESVSLDFTIRKG